MSSPGIHANGARARQIPLAAGLTFLLAFAFYLYTLQPSLAWGDGVKVQIETITGESFIQSVLPDELFAADPYPFAKVGVAAWDHPLYVMLGHALVQLVAHAHDPWLINTISAVFGAATVLVLFLFCYSHTRSYASSLLAAGSLAISHTFWFHSVTAEVYTLNAFLLLSAVYLYDRFENTGGFSRLVGSAFVLGLGISNHLMTALALPAILLSFLVSRDGRRTAGFSPKKVGVVGLAFLAGLSPYLIQFMRTLRVLDFSEAIGPVIGSVFLQGLLTTTPQMVLNSFSTYLLFLVYQFNPVGLLIGIYGFFQARRTAGSLWPRLFAFYLIYTLFGVFYRVTDQFAFFLLSYVFFGLAIALGLHALVVRYPAMQRVAYAGFGLSVLAMPLLYSQLPALAHRFGFSDQTMGIPQVGTGTRDGLAYYLDPNKRADVDAYQFGEQFFFQAPPNALVIAEWYTDTDEFFVLNYFSSVERLRPDIDIEGWPLEDPSNFNSTLVVRLVEQEIEKRPIFLASLSEEFYAARFLATRYCIVPELNLYRVYPDGTAAAGTACQTV